MKKYDECIITFLPTVEGQLMPVFNGSTAFVTDCNILQKVGETQVQMTITLPRGVVIESETP